MPRRRIPVDPLPRRLDRRRRRGNATAAQQRPRRGPRGQVETIAGRRVIALRLRRGGASYREIAEQLGVDVATAYADIRAELADLRQQTVEEASELRALELQRSTL
jgi:DNA-binding CsgD family transcriptional regulator